MEPSVTHAKTPFRDTSPPFYFSMNSGGGNTNIGTGEDLTNDEVSSAAFGNTDTTNSWLQLQQLQQQQQAMMLQNYGLSQMNNNLLHSSYMQHQHQAQHPVNPTASMFDMNMGQNMTGNAMSQFLASTANNNSAIDPMMMYQAHGGGGGLDRLTNASASSYLVDQIAKNMKPIKKKRTKKPKECPRRPLSAYNVFFKEERTRILDALAAENAANAENEEAPGKIGFENLAKTIGARWKKVPADDLARYRELAKMDHVRYTDEMKVYEEKLHRMKEKEEEANNAVKKQEDAVREAAKGAADAAAAAIPAQSASSTNVRPFSSSEDDAGNDDGRIAKKPKIEQRYFNTEGLGQSTQNYPWGNSQLQQELQMTQSQQNANIHNQLQQQMQLANAGNLNQVGNLDQADQDLLQLHLLQQSMFRNNSSARGGLSQFNNGMHQLNHQSALFGSAVPGHQGSMFDNNSASNTQQLLERYLQGQGMPSGARNFAPPGSQE